MGMEHEEEDEPLPNTLILERVQALLVEARDVLRLVCAREYTREFNIACQRKRRANMARPVVQTPSSRADHWN
jgi:hypothetical protein